MADMTGRRKLVAVLLWLFPILHFAPWSLARATACSDGQITTFELITGAIFTSDKGKINSFQTFDLNECIASCRNNPSCASANFETGLCTTSQATAAVNPESLRTDDFPVFPNYLEKLCLQAPSDSCAKDWSFQGVIGYYLPGYDVKVIPVQRKEDCLNACLKEDSFQCFSAEMRYNNMTCALSNVSQSSLQVKLQKVTDPTLRVDYFENNCAYDPRMYCEYNRVRGRVLKAADMVRSKVANLEECKALCLSANFSCNYYHYGQLSDDECSLSHHTAATVSHINEPYVFSADFVSYELRACFAVELICEAKRMTARIDTNRVFDGLVYAKQQPKACLNDVINSTEFELSMPLDGTQCNTANNGHGKYSNYIMIQNNDKIVTSKDVGLSVSCEYDLSSRNVTGTLSTNGAPSITENVNYKVPSPIVQMSIRDLNGNPVVSATVGDKIFLQFDLAAAGSADIYNIFVKDVIAVDGATTAAGRSKIKMIDSNGCPSDDIVLGPVESINDGKTVRIPIEAFKFPSNDEVEFMAMVKPCQRQCEPAQCIDEATQIVYNSYGRRRRRRDLTTDVDTSDTEWVRTVANNTHDNEFPNVTKGPGKDKDVMVRQRINVNDFATKTNKNCPGGECPGSGALYASLTTGNSGKLVMDSTGIVCIHKLAIAVGASVVLLIQVVSAVALAFICQRYRTQRTSRFKASLDISAPVNHHPNPASTITSGKSSRVQAYPERQQRLEVPLSSGSSDGRSEAGTPGCSSVAGYETFPHQDRDRDEGGSTQVVLNRKSMHTEFDSGHCA
ncbi:uncharacterized protein LOC129593722 isoform X2 [Paramacrobiotus metropolitanus]|uniref:uncharacterized protein LOC129593722 isoform X2 n=1 Tax=Paramacrobiotus metropolitanus TaxID=2943436 RepID=UPI002445E402|nr:uncharacterized protein LOC129593722 isoform X2 [Paramacrobiotus metropolitanus]